jgi:hypothetical protein
MQFLPQSIAIVTMLLQRRWQQQKIYSPQFFYKNNQGIEASVAMLLGNCF